MNEDKYLELSKDGKSIIRCKENYEGIVYIPFGITKIEVFAFANCSRLTSVVIPKSITEIGGQAFYNCTSLTSISIPESVVKIGIDSFSYCTRLTQIAIDENNPKYSSKDGVLFSKDMSELIAVPGGKDSLEIPESVKKFSELAINGCKYLTTIKIPNGVTEIKSGSFAGCTSLTSISIPESVIKIGGHVFSGCNNLKEIHFKHKTPKDFFHAFFLFDISNVTIYVPLGSGEAYSKHELYRKFKDRIKEKEDE